MVYFGPRVLGGFIFSHEQFNVVLHLLGSERETRGPALDATMAELVGV